MAEITRTEIPPHIDGLTDEAVWQNAVLLSGFSQYNPDYGHAATQATEVFLLYDDAAIYVAARMFDTAPDSILTQLGSRDDGGLNADWFGVQFDTYHNQLDAYTFRVYASGVQMDSRVSDWTYDAVWKSAVRIDAAGWSVEMEIPWSALRFPGQKVQMWGVQIQRYIRRNREDAQWALGRKGVPNQLKYWGTLIGLRNLKPPVRLALTPYFAIAGLHDQSIKEPAARTAYSFGGGADLKVGLNESYTVDMTLFPDFSQVKSDNRVKNLSAFETVYSEQRPFFNEGVDLFKQGGLFYSRRIGGVPLLRGETNDFATNTETIIDNPMQARLLNALKISGRGNYGLAIGFLNALTGNTYATLENQQGVSRRILTDPFTNYNIVVLDQALRNNSSAYLINTSVLRSQKFDDANVTGAGLNLLNAKNTYRINISGAVSQKFTYDDEKSEYNAERGYKYYASAGRVSGNFQFSLYRSAMNDTYNDNDLGITHRNDFVENGASINYYIFEPVGILRSANSYLRMSSETSFTTRKNLNFLLQTGAGVTYRNYLSNWINFNYSLAERYDYYDPRTEGRFTIRPGYINGDVRFSTDYRRLLAADGTLWMGFDPDGYYSRTFSISPRVRVSDKLFFDYSFRLGITDNYKGYVTRIDSTNEIIYGNRFTQSIENVISGRFMFRNNLSLSLWMRHYWYQGTYNKYYSLSQNGYLVSNNRYNQNNDFNFNTFNLDLILNWEFAPGSNLSVVWKNSVVQDDAIIIDSFIDNLDHTLQADQLNQISVKFLYYLDYSAVFKGRG
jgi:hypothetical protein